MRILVYSREDHAIISTIESNLLVNGSVLFKVAITPEVFIKEMKKCLNGETIFIFFVFHGCDMDFLKSIEKDFIDIKLVIYIAAEDKDFKTRAYGFHPRVVTGFFDSNAFLPAAVNGILNSLLGAKEQINK